MLNLTGILRKVLRDVATGYYERQWCKYQNWFGLRYWQGSVICDSKGWRCAKRRADISDNYLKIASGLRKVICYFSFFTCIPRVTTKKYNYGCLQIGEAFNSVLKVVSSLLQNKLRVVLCQDLISNIKGW